MRSIRNSRAIITLAVWSIASCALALVIVLPASLQATGAGEISARSEVVNPHLAIGATDVSVRCQDINSPVKAGDSLVLVLTAKNESDKQVAIYPTVTLSAVPAANRMSRVVPMPKEIWRSQQTVLLSAGESKSITLEKIPSLPAGNDFFISLRDESKTVVVMRLNVAKS